MGSPTTPLPAPAQGPAQPPVHTITPRTYSLWETWLHRLGIWDKILVIIWILMIVAVVTMLAVLFLEAVPMQYYLYSDKANEVDLRSVAITVASISAGAGSVIIVFIAFVSEQVTRPFNDSPASPLNPPNPSLKFPMRYRQDWYQARLRMIMINCTVAICALLLGAVVTLLALFYRFVSSEWVVLLSFSLFTFGICCFVFQLLAYVVQDIKRLTSSPSMAIKYHAQFKPMPFIRFSWHHRAITIIQALLVLIAGLAWGLGWPIATFYLLLTFVVPTVLATLVTFYAEADYRTLRRKFFTDRVPAGVAVVRSLEGRVLLNRQKEYPWKDMWILLGGYYNPAEFGDRSPRDTALRRAKELVKQGAGVDISTNVRAGVYIAESQINEDEYEEATLRYIHAPTDDQAYEIVHLDDSRFSEREIDCSNAIDLKWWSLDQAKASSNVIPEHMLDLIIYSLDPTVTGPEHWTVHERNWPR
jgi:hypothetical protein